MPIVWRSITYVEKLEAPHTFRCYIRPTPTRPPKISPDLQINSSHSCLQYVQVCKVSKHQLTLTKRLTASLICQTSQSEHFRQDGVGRTKKDWNALSPRWQFWSSCVSVGFRRVVDVRSTGEEDDMVAFIFADNIQLWRPRGEWYAGTETFSGGNVEEGEEYNIADMLRPERTFECMKKAYDCGINFFDTAERSCRYLLSLLC